MRCQSSASQEGYPYETREIDSLSTLPTADDSPCEALWKSLPSLSLPYTAKAATEAQESREPFPPYLQSWLKEKLNSDSITEPIYSPIGQIRYTGYTLWLIETTAPEGTFTYAVLVSSDCQVYDKLQVAGLKGALRYMILQSTVFHADGTLTLTDEYHEVDLTVEPPQTSETIRQLRYRVDPERRRFVAI